MAPLRGGGLKGTRVRGFAPQGHWRTPTFLGALRCDKLTAPGAGLEVRNELLFEIGAEASAVDRAVDGVMGQRTDTALLNHQSDHGLAITGRLDRETKNTLHIG